VDTRLDGPCLVAPSCLLLDIHEALLHIARNFPGGQAAEHSSNGCFDRIRAEVRENDSLRLANHREVYFQNLAVIVLSEWCASFGFETSR